MDWLDKILGPKPKQKRVNVNKVINNRPIKVKRSDGVTEIHNHFHINNPTMPNVQPFRAEPPKKKFLSTMESYDEDGNILNPVTLKKEMPGVLDSDNDGVPNIIDPAPFNPKIPNTMTKQFKSKRVNRVLNSIMGGDD